MILSGIRQAARGYRYVGRTAPARSKVALIGAVPPLMLKTEANPGGLPIVRLRWAFARAL